MPLFRGYKNLTVVKRINDNEFIGTVETNRWVKTDDGRDYRLMETPACGWSKGGSFFVYAIMSGGIQKIGTLKRAELFDDDLDLV